MGANPQTTRRSRDHDPRRALWLAWLLLGGCLPQWPPDSPGREVGGARHTLGQDGAAAGIDGGIPADGASCRPLLTGELRLHEIALRPTGLDFDGDGVVNLRDEWIEVLSLAEEPAHAGGVVVYVDGVRRGEVVAGACLAPGALAVIVGATTGAGGLAAGVTRLRLNASLKLPDGARSIALRALSAADHDATTLPAPANEGPIVWTRWPQIAAAGAWRAHSEVAGGRPWSPGRCSDGDESPGCAVARAPPAAVATP